MGTAEAPIDPSLLHLELSLSPQLQPAPQEWLNLSLLHLALTMHPQIDSSTKLWSGEPEPGSPNYSRFLHKEGFPPEIRKKIYDALLVNPMLGEVAAIEREENFGANAKYGLFPAILRVNRQVYDEASKTLYESNRFVVDAVSFRENPKGVTGLVQPLTRFMNLSTFPATEVDDWYSGFSKIRDWKVIIKINIGRPQSIYFKSFCQQVARSSLRSLEVVVLPQLKHIDRRTVASRLLFTLSDLSILRGIGNLQIRDAPTHDLVGVHTYPIPEEAYLPIIQSLGADERDQLRHIVDLARGDSPVESLCEMYNHLADYTQLFEGYGPFKLEMRYYLPFHPAQWGSEYLKFKSSNWENPYTGLHPVELALRRAREAREDRDTTEFKVQRDTVLQYLEAQYQRMLAASINIVEFIKREKRVGGLFEYASGGSYYRHARGRKYEEALVLLEDYAKTFERDMPLEVRKVIRKQARYFQNIYSSMDAQLKLRALDILFEEEDLEGFIQLFKESFDLLDKRFLAIIASRKALFRSDITQRCCDIDPGISNCEERVDWEVNEPGITVSREPTEWN
jgi:hypothetical protein